MLYNPKPKQLVKDIFQITMACSGHIPIFTSNKDYVEFIFAFYCYFMIDYKKAHTLDPKIRKKAADIFLEKVKSSRPTFTDVSQLDKYFDNFNMAFFTITKASKTKGDFIIACADYMNAQLTLAIDEDGYPLGYYEDLEKTKAKIKPDIFTDLIIESITLNTSWLIN